MAILTETPGFGSGGYSAKYFFSYVIPPFLILNMLSWITAPGFSSITCSFILCNWECYSVKLSCYEMWFSTIWYLLASQVALVVKNQPANARRYEMWVLSLDQEDPLMDGGKGNPLPCSCLENLMDRGAWQATVYRVSKSQTQLQWLSMHTMVFTHPFNKRLFSILYREVEMLKILRSPKMIKQEWGMT